MLEQRIQELWAQAERLGRPVVAHRKPGVSTEFLEQCFGVSVPHEVALWFGWCNGIAYHPNQTQDEAALVPGYEPLAVEEAAAIQGEYPEDPVLGSRWFPILGTGGGDFYALTETRESKRSAVVSVVVGEATRIAANSLEELLDIFIECFNSGIFHNDADGFFQADDERWIELEERAVGRGDI
ncbi:SMI1/KNR4 family protein [Streptomyces phaeochromogenes]